MLAFRPLHRRSLSSLAVTISKEHTLGSLVCSTRPLPTHPIQDSLKLAPAAPLVAPGSGQVKLGLVSAPVWASDVAALSSGAIGSTPGLSGLFQVSSVGPNVTRFTSGDLAMPARFSWGTWRAEAVADEKDLVKIPASLGASPSAAVDLLSHVIALRLLSGLKKGDVVGCTGGLSALGLAVTVVGARLGLRVVCIAGAELEPIKGMKKLKDAGAELVVAHEWENGQSYTGSFRFRRLVADLPPAKLVINTTGGAVAADASRLLEKGGEFVTLGGAPVTLPASLFVQRGVVAKGFDLRTATAALSIAELQALADQAAKSVAATNFTAAVVPFSLAEAGSAVDAVGFGPTPVLQLEVKRAFAQPVENTKLKQAFAGKA